MGRKAVVKIAAFLPIMIWLCAEYGKRYAWGKEKNDEHTIRKTD